MLAPARPGGTPSSACGFPAEPSLCFWGGVCTEWSAGRKPRFRSVFPRPAGPWIRSACLESPHNTWGVVGRMALEIFLFRSLFRNTKMSLQNQKPYYGGAKWLWLAGLAFHGSFLVILTRHLRFFTEPVPMPIGLLATLDGLFEISLPTLYLTDAALVVAVTYLFLRRVAIPQIRYISLAADYFPLFLLLGIAISGMLMRHVYKVDLQKIKELSLGWFAFQPCLPEGIGVIFYIHLFLVCTLLVYFPFSKLMHMGGVFFSPTRNLANNNRMRRHVNPWNYRVKVHTYEEYEEEFRERMKEAGVPLEKE
jgi:nitrate reductase gamma subunit